MGLLSLPFFKQKRNPPNTNRCDKNVFNIPFTTKVRSGEHANNIQKLVHSYLYNPSTYPSKYPYNPSKYPSKYPVHFQNYERFRLNLPRSTAIVRLQMSKKCVNNNSSHKISQNLKAKFLQGQISSRKINCEDCFDQLQLATEINCEDCLDQLQLATRFDSLV